MKYIIITDLEGAAGVDAFVQTRTSDNMIKGPGMKQLALEVNACVAGIKSTDSSAIVDVIDGHGTGGLFPEDLIDSHYISLIGTSVNHLLKDYDAMLFVGQHAMAGTVAAPLNHTYSSLDVMYYRLNGIFIGEFGARALLAGLKGIPVIFLSGDDKAAAEARMFIPGIVTSITKQGLGLEFAEHLSSEEACRRIQEAAAEAVKRIGHIPAYTDLQPPFIFEARYYEPIVDSYWLTHPTAKLIDERTVQLMTSDVAELPF
ncbi:peptidase M55 [Paenibacillus sp. FSL H8-0548]|uniref:M55 family metallopeptidase n=1 Tax=Paenibacillus sp. FSL H8-0548 TaxID=1920422 RepID=UPI00096FCB0E|nr:M55 family metallopeptidase [Paenibacillus sp. FSL H8-0548]OMF22082.1 peptidase M55 [Paenibacillus sp. FSL H8-0548]